MASRHTRMYFSAIFLGATLFSEAQLAYDYPTAIPPLGSYVADRYSCFTSPPVSTSPPWDFGSLIFEPPQTMTWEWAPLSAGLFPASYPGATHVFKHVTEDYEEVMLLTPTELRQVGLASNVAGQMDDSLVMRIFPSFLGTTYSDTYRLAGEPGNSTAQFTPQAVGTLITPFGTQPDAVLLEMERTSFTGLTLEHSYKWYAPNNLLVPLAEYYITSGVLVVNAGISTGLPEVDAQLARTWPVPANGTVMIDTPERVLRAELVSMSGSSSPVALTTTTAGCTFDISSHAPGVYRLRLLTSLGWSGSTLVKQ